MWRRCKRPCLHTREIAFRPFGRATFFARSKKVAKERVSGDLPFSCERLNGSQRFSPQTRSPEGTSLCPRRVRAPSAHPSGCSVHGCDARQRLTELKSKDRRLRSCSFFPFCRAETSAWAPDDFSRTKIQGCGAGSPVSPCLSDRALVSEGRRSWGAFSAYSLSRDKE